MTAVPSSPKSVTVVNLNPGAQEWVPTFDGPKGAKPSARRRPTRGKSDYAAPPQQQRAVPRSKRHVRGDVADAARAGHVRKGSIDGSDRGGARAARGASRHSKSIVGFLKVHAPNCECVRLRRQRERERVPPPADSGYLVVSRDVRTPDASYAFAPAAAALASGGAPARRDAELWLRAAIAAAEPGSDAPGPRMSCAACLLDGDWRNGAAVVVGSFADVDAACDTANAELKMRCDADGHAVPHATVCVAVGVQALLLGAESAAAAAAAAAAADAGLADAIVRVVSHDASAPLRSALEKRGLGDMALDCTVEIKHHIQEALNIVDFKNAEAILVRAYVDHHGHASLDLPGGKRHLAETAWEAAVREMDDECALKCHAGADAFEAMQGHLDCEGRRFKVASHVDGQSVRFFLLRPGGEAEPEPAAGAAAAPEVAAGAL